MPTFVLISANTHCDPYPVYPLALSYLSAYLAEQMPDLALHSIDLNWMSLDDALASVERYQPDFVGISLRNIDNVDAIKECSFIEQYQRLMQGLRERIQVPIILGGAGFSIFPALLCELLQPDYAIQGEGETRLLALLQALREREAIPAMPGFYRQGVWDDCQDPLPYLKRPVLTFDDALAPAYWQHSGMLNVQTKRGCPYQCVYCTYPLIDGRRVRTLDIDNIITSIRAMKADYGARYVFFTDSVFNIKNEFNRQLARAMIDARLDVQWGAYFSPFRLGEEDLALYRDAGLTHVEFGTESLSDTTLRLYGKPFNIGDVFTAAEACDRLGIHQAHFLIFGGPGETDATLTETFTHAAQLPPCVLFPYVGMRIYPGTPLYQTALEEGYLEKDNALLKPAFYCSPAARLDRLKAMAETSPRRWVFSDEDHSQVMLRIRQRKRLAGPLWEMLVQ